MGSGNHGGFGNTKGCYKETVNNLPKNPDTLMQKGWKDITPPQMSKNTTSKMYKDGNTGLTVRFDKGQKGAGGYGSKDHYHVLNPKASGRDDYYLDKNCNPVPKNSKASHIIP